MDYDAIKVASAALFQKVFYNAINDVDNDIIDTTVVKTFDSILENRQLYALIVRLQTDQSALPPTLPPTLPPNLPPYQQATCALLATIREHDMHDVRAISNIASNEQCWDLQVSKVNLWLCCTDVEFRKQGLMFGSAQPNDTSISVFDEFIAKLRSEGIKYYRVATIARKYPAMYNKLESLNYVIRYQVQENGNIKTVYFMVV